MWLLYPLQFEVSRCCHTKKRYHVRLFMAPLEYYYNKSNTECGIIRPTNAIHMGSHSLLGSELSGVPKYLGILINSIK